MSPLWLRSLPWSTIISNAPLIVDGAKKLVSLVKSKPATDIVPPAGDVLGDPRLELMSLRARVQRLEEEQGQAADLVRAMAETQAQMTQVLEGLRVRARVSLRVALVSAAGVVVLLVWMLAR